MKYYSRALAGTALGLFMAASTASAASLRPAVDGNGDSAVQAPLLMAQADTENPDQKEKKKERRAERRAEKNAGEQGAQKNSGGQGGDQHPQGQEAPKHQRQNADQKRGSGQPQDSVGQAPAANQAPVNQTPAIQTPAIQKRDKKQRQQTGGETPSVTQAPQNAQPETGQAPEIKRGKKDRGAGERKAPSGENQAEKPRTGEQPAETGQSGAQPGTKPQMPARNATPDNNGGATNEAQSPELKGEKGRRHSGQTGSPAQNAAPSQNTGKEAGGQGGETTTKKEGGQPELPSNAGTRQLGGKPGMESQKGLNGRPQMNEAANPLPENAAPVLDSDKRRHGRDNGQAGANDRNGRHGGDRNERNAGNGNQPPVNAGPPPKSDAAAQDFRRRGKIEVQSVDSVKGKRIEGDRRPRWQRPKDADVVKEIGSRVIINLGGQTIVQSTDHDRLRHHARDTYYEDLPHGRVRETIERPDGSRVVTIRNEYGDVIRRSRFTSGGREIVLVYVDDDDLARDRGHGWRDPGDDLPPMRLTVPVTQYILDSDNVRSPDRYYEFLDQPPVERVERLYTLGDVRRSARIRDMMPRVDLDTINFDTGSAEVSPDQANDLEGVAEAMKRIINRNPGETFLIEGHTDAVGDPDSNLALSDERAESVAGVLSDDFGIPPENLVTQGYGEEYLKVDTDGPNRENRRVAIRRITPLVSPVAQQQ
jgi:outer membrane protein OmpA-like peptidoglycan-associated protein